MKSACIRSYCGPYFFAFGQNTERCGVFSPENMRKNTDHNNSEYGHFLGSEYQISSRSFASTPELIKGFFQTSVMRNIVFAFD